MGGNREHGAKSNSTITRTCTNCKTKFEDGVRFNPQKYCPSCKQKLQTSNNTTANIQTQINKNTQQITIEITLQSTIENNLSLPIETFKNQNEEIIGYLQIQSENGDIWYENAWVETDERYGFYIRTERKTQFKIPNQQEQTNYYQSKTGNIFDAKTLYCTFEFIDDNIKTITKEITL